MKFQFPTGWNSTYDTLPASELNLCFNSQRDGILQKRDTSWFYSARVSIPNGMEFYKQTILMRFRRGLVSIPNGMEFYKTALRRKTATNSFNSQRDGILLLLAHTSIATWVVSIPNGMEFYEILKAMATLTRGSFNSQRDGILQNLLPFLEAELVGFNSQRDGILLSYLSAFACSLV